MTYGTLRLSRHCDEIPLNDSGILALPSLLTPLTSPPQLLITPQHPTPPPEFAQIKDRGERSKSRFTG